MPLQAPHPWPVKALRSAAPKNGASPSFVSQLKQIEHELGEAQQCVATHQYAAAQQKLAPHLGHLPDTLAGAAYLILGQCAMHGAGHNWPALLNKARAAYQNAGDVVGAAHVRLQQGIGFFARGDLGQAQTQLSAARSMFQQARVAWGHAMASGLQVPVFLAQHDVDGAMYAADTAIEIWAYLNEAAEESLVRQVRAQLFASAGRMQDASRDLLWAERLVGAEASQDVRTQLTLGRADSLLWMGYSHRAAAALSKIAAHATEHPDSWVRAHFHRVMGQALMVDAPVIAAQHLNIAADLLQQLGHGYALAQAYMHLACCEHRLGVSTAARLQSARALGISQWPVLRDAIENIERFVQAPPGRLTGPQPVKVFDPDALADTPPARKSSGAAMHAMGTVDTASDPAALTEHHAWGRWLTRLQSAWGRMGPFRLFGRLDDAQISESAVAQTIRSMHKQQQSSIEHGRQAPQSAAPQAKMRQSRAVQEQVEVTQV